MSWAPPHPPPGATRDPTNDPNVYFDKASQRWCRWNPQTAEATYLVPQPPPPRSGPEAVAAANRAFARSTRQEGNAKSGGRGKSRALSNSSGADELTYAMRNASLGDQDYIHTQPTYPYSSWQTEEVTQDAGMPSVLLGPPEEITDPGLRVKGHSARAKLYGHVHGNKQLLDPRFVIQKRRNFFVPGRVIKVFWPELAGNLPENTTQVTFTSTKFQDVRMIGKIRWFVVVLTGHNACTCLPISTYGNRGVSNTSVLKWHHCIVHVERQPPALLEGEEPSAHEQPMRTPIRIDPKNPGDRMEPASRLNYGKMYTVEHNVRVYDFGMVRPEYIATLTGNWGQVLGYESVQRQALIAHGLNDEYSQEYSTSLPQTPSSTRRYDSYNHPSKDTPPKDSEPDPLPSLLPEYVDFGHATNRYTPPESEQARQISVKQGDRLAIIDWPYEGWAKAHNTRSRETGMVPYSYISLYRTATALFTWAATDPQSYVTIEKDDELRLIDYASDDWATVWNRRTADTGLVPRNYITTKSKQ